MILTCTTIFSSITMTILVLKMHVGDFEDI
jgi:hypothetical protein